MLLYRLVRYVLGPGLLATAPLHQTWKAQVTSILPGLLIIEGANWVSSRRSQREARQRDRAIKAREVESAHRRIVEILIDAVTVFEAHRRAEDGRYRANVLLVEGDIVRMAILRMAYRTPGYTAEEEALEWHRGEGCAGRAWEREETTVAPIPGSPLPTVGDASAPSRGWGMTSSQVLSTRELKAVISVPIFSSSHPSQVVAVFNLDDTLPPTDYGRPTFNAAEGVAARVAEQLTNTGANFPKERAPQRPHDES